MNQLPEQSDTLYTREVHAAGAFRFDAHVADVFADMIRRSVPGYDNILQLTGLLAAERLKAGERLYELGCSLGAGVLAVAARLPHQHAHIIAVDNAPEMIARARQQVLSLCPDLELEFRCEDIRETTILEASIVVMNFTLQFIPLADRLPLLRRIRSGMKADSVMVLSEKIAHSNTDSAAILTRIHEAFKKENGYSELEIARKRSALENVLIPETIETHRQRLLEAGFSRVECWYQHLNFASLLAWT